MSIVRKPSGYSGRQRAAELDAADAQLTHDGKAVKKHTAWRWFTLPLRIVLNVFSYSR